VKKNLRLRQPAHLWLPKGVDSCLRRNDRVESSPVRVIREDGLWPILVSENRPLFDPPADLPSEQQGFSSGRQAQGRRLWGWLWLNTGKLEKFSLEMLIALASRAGLHVSLQTAA
jgi:hypothetical protein